MSLLTFLPVAGALEGAGLLWRPEIGDEVSQRDNPEQISILVDPQGMTPKDLRIIYVWLPTVEQLVEQVEAREAQLFHVGMELSETAYCYKTILQSRVGTIESKAETLRASLGISLQKLITGSLGTSHWH